MKELREHNENMLRNILPSHVARHFLEKDRDNEVRPGPSAGTAGCRCGEGRRLDAWAPGSGSRPPSSRAHTGMETTPATWRQAVPAA